MTNTVAYRLQSWFTKFMPATAPAKQRETNYEKAQRILADPARVIASPDADPPHYWTGRVVGDHGTYVVVAVSAALQRHWGIDVGRVACTCRAGRGGRLCSHMLVAEEMRLRGEDE